MVSLQMKTLLAAILFTLFFTPIHISGQSPVGVWETIDDSTGKARSYVEVYEQNGKFYGKITKLLLRDDNPKCEKCPKLKKDKPIIGLVIIEEMPKHKGFWKGGTILDPESGKNYKCSLWFENDNYDTLFVRGRHWTGLYRTQTWNRVK